ncbi:sugar O-acetyltransferase [Listeria booriae]|uniref:Sugar O-acetyltransferase n=1 Tax=Listeria booriae TaxID=1552123 RepID=A0A7X1CCJ2_9LIST|nr:DapH/DapD/GlmU-related protein [Listeria booriae]MBC1492470.1 sugar O-acetyltransferase [Listeria booriae]MBC1505023.1 sugar O-acetyltransferase [Listeria booriae]MBC1525670.1 sugar O-acetyltransferase [Listeria booriae]MBC1531140.1 sugar O-acetyltransferase [Listeria booriae]MBC6135339.1 sugar O-acetyltransferase [Listeria booriae]
MSDLDLQSKLIGKDVLKDSALYQEIHLVKQNNEQLIIELNTQYHTKEKILRYLEEITGKAVDSSVDISLPFYSDFGKHITFGKNIFINQNVTFVDLGGIVIEDEVLIGPGATLITVNHLLNPENRRGLRVAPICIKKNAWIGANATILPGITVGENSVVAASAIVTKDVPDNVIVAGVPAKQISNIE